MGVRIIPTRTDLGNYDESVSLDGDLFILQFRFNTRDSSWYLDLKLEDGTFIRAGLRLVPNFPLLRLLSRADAPKGEIAVLDTRPVPAPPGQDELNKEVPLVYLEA